MEERWYPTDHTPEAERENQEIRKILRAILEARWKKAEAMERRGQELARERAEVQEMLTLSGPLAKLQPGGLESLCGDRLAEQIKADRRQLESCLEQYDRAIRANTAMHERFQRKTINLTVIGKIGSGKSKFLQTVSGLGNECIPSLMGASCTGVTSIIENVTDGATRALITFKTEQEVIANLDQEAVGLAAKIAALQPEESPLEVKGKITALDDAQIVAVFDQLGRVAEQLYQGGNKEAQNHVNEAKTLREAYTTHRKEWYPFLGQDHGAIHQHDADLKQVSGAGEPTVYCLDKRERIREYVSKHGCFRYIAVKNVVVQTHLQDLEGDIRLVDTVGIGDPSADTRARLEEAIRNESDGVIVLMRARERVENDESIDNEDIALLNQFRAILHEHWNKCPGLWMSFLLNNATGDKRALQPFAEKYLTWIARTYGNPGDLFGPDGIQMRAVVDVSDGPAVRKYVRSFLEYISGNLVHIDEVLDEETAQQIGKARKEKERLWGRLKGWSESIVVSQQDLNYVQILMEERIDQLENELSQYTSWIKERGKNAGQCDASYLQQRLSMVRRLMQGETLPELSTDLQKIITQACKTYPADFAQARLAAIRQLPEAIRRIAILPSQEQTELEQRYKADLAGLFVRNMGIDLERCAAGGQPPLQTTDPHFFQKLAGLILSNVGKTSEIRDAFLSLDRFRLDEMNGVTKVLFIHHASQHLVELPYLRKKQLPGEPSKVQSAKALILEQSGKADSGAPEGEAEAYVTPGNEKRLMRELQDKLQAFADAVQDSAGRETYLVSYYDQMLEELYHFMQVFTPEFQGYWLLVFHDLKERGLLTGDEQVWKSHERLKEVAFRLKERLERVPEAGQGAASVGT